MQTNQRHVVPCVKGVEWGFDTRDLRIVAAFWAGIPQSLQRDLRIVGIGREVKS